MKEVRWTVHSKVPVPWLLNGEEMAVFFSNTVFFKKLTHVVGGLGKISND